MKLLGILGSPRRQGNSEYLLDLFLAGAADAGIETEKLVVADCDISPCLECGDCGKTGFCVVDDGMTEIYEKISAADFLVVASPTFFAGLPAQLKALIDRFQCFWIAKYVLKKPRQGKAEGRKAWFILTGGQQREDFFLCSEKVIKAFTATAGFKYQRGFYCAGLDAAGDAAGNEDYRVVLFKAGASLAE